MTYDFWIQTFSGRRVSLVDPQPDDIHFEDIAHALAMQCRFNGHSKLFYSVAQHSIHVSRLCDRQHALVGLLHDATEAYIGDIVRPLKGLFRQHAGEFLDEVETRIWIAISARFFDGEIKPLDVVEQADLVALATEKRDILGKGESEWELALPPADPMPITPLAPAVVKPRFLARFLELGGKP